MKLVTELVEHVDVRVQIDEETKQKSHFIEGVFLQSELKNRNGRMYPKEILMNGKLGDLFRVGDYKNLSKKILVFYKNISRIVNIYDFPDKRKIHKNKTPLIGGFIIVINFILFSFFWYHVGIILISF